ncbi:MAG: carbohydrate-binding domain-containing protein, partial [Janthinobacterium lividum]
DGQQLGAAQSVTAQHGTGTEAFSFAPSLTPGTHQVSIAFVNDLWTPGVGDRNLYVEGITLGGVAVPVSNGALYSNGAYTTAVTEPTTLAATAPTPTPTPVPTPASTPTPTSTSTSTDSLVVSLSEDAFQGDAQFTVSVDGKQLAGVDTVTALHGAGAPQAYSFAPSLTPGTHQVSIAFVNDLWNPGVGDRNLYVEGITLGGVAVPVSNGTLYSNGAYTTTVTEPATPTPTPVPTPTATPITSDTLVLKLSEDAFQGDAQFTVSVDGKSLGAAQTVTAQHGAGASQAFSFSGQFGSGVHDVAVTFTNDNWNPGVGDRNLYVDGASLNGTASTNTGSITLLDGTHAAHMMIGTTSV